MPPEAAADLLRWFVREFNLLEFKAVCEYCVQATVTGTCHTSSPTHPHSQDHTAQKLEYKRVTAMGAIR